MRSGCFNEAHLFGEEHAEVVQDQFPGFRHLRGVATALLGRDFDGLQGMVHFGDQCLC